MNVVFLSVINRHDESGVLRLPIGYELRFAQHGPALRFKSRQLNEEKGHLRIAARLAPTAQQHRKRLAITITSTACIMLALIPDDTALAIADDRRNRAVPVRRRIPAIHLSTFHCAFIKFSSAFIG